MTRAYLFTSNLSLEWWYAATKCAIYVINRLPRPPRKFLIETFSSKQWDMSKLQPFSCMCSFHVPKLMRGVSADLRPTLKAGIFIGFSLTSHKYMIFVISSSSIVERSRVYFISDVFPDDLGGAIVTTNGSTTHDVAAPTRLHVEKSPTITRPAENEGNTPGLTKGTPDKEPSMESHGTNVQTLTEPIEGSTTGNATVVPSPKRRIPTFPKCPRKDKAVDFELEADFIMEEELSTQNADMKESNVITTKRNRRMPDEYLAVPASQKGDKLAATAIVLCACMHCPFLRNEGVTLATPALLADSIVLPKNYESVIAGPYAEQWKGACEK